jgi:hypothetical protein
MKFKLLHDETRKQHFSKLSKIIFLLLLCCSQANSQKNLSVKIFGASGNGLIDDTAYIQAAIDSGYKSKSPVFIPAGTYMVSNIIIKTSLIGSPGTIIKKIKTKQTEPYKFCNVNKSQNLQISNVTFDGSVGLDSHGKTNSGSIPLHVYNSQNIEIKNCSFKNSVMSGLRVEASRIINIINCISEGSRGIYGDGYYFSSSSKIQVINCVASDYWRIGFVTEKNSYDATFDSCTAKNGTHASILSGGIEYNGGFWFENSANIRAINCLSKNNTHWGFTATTGKRVSEIDTAKRSIFTFKNCVSENNPNGFYLGSAGKPVEITTINCKALNVVRGFNIKSRSTDDIFRLDSSLVKMIPLSPTSANAVAFNWESTDNNQTSPFRKSVKIAKLFISDAYIEYQKPILENVLLSKLNNNGDISTYAGGSLQIEIKNVRNSLSHKNLIIKSRRGNPFYKLNNVEADPRFIRQGSVLPNNK